MNAPSHLDPGWLRSFTEGAEEHKRKMLAQLTTDLRYDGGDLKHTSLPPVPSIVSRRFEAARTFDKTITALLEPAGGFRHFEAVLGLERGLSAYCVSCLAV